MPSNQTMQRFKMMKHLQANQRGRAQCSRSQARTKVQANEMECIAQYLDDLEDLIYAFALKWERIQRVARFALFVLTSGLFQIVAVTLALINPPLATAVASLLLVTLLYRGAVGFPAEPFSIS